MMGAIAEILMKHSDLHGGRIIYPKLFLLRKLRIRSCVIRKKKKKMFDNLRNKFDVPIENTAGPIHRCLVGCLHSSFYFIY